MSRLEGEDLDARKMANTGLLLLTAPVKQLRQRMQLILSRAARNVQQVLYIQFQPGLEPSILSSQEPFPATNELANLITQVYSYSGNAHRSLDVRVLLSNISDNIPIVSSFPQQLSSCPAVVLTDSSLSSDQVLHHLSQWIITVPEPKVKKLCSDHPSEDSRTTGIADFSSVPCPESSVAASSTPSSDIFQTYKHVVLGGTFDRLHAGHKILLSESAMRANDKITVGVTDGAMLSNKTLSELILPLQRRIHSVTKFIQDIKPSLLHEDAVVPITDPFGPSIVVPEMDCIVVSDETRRGGDSVNKRRAEKGLNKLDIHIIDLVPDKDHAEHEEAKVSSSSTRARLLGKLLKCPKVPQEIPSPYIIGLTGGIASGKSSVCKRLAGLGAAIIDCDKLGHRAYEPGTIAHQQIVDMYGQDVLAADGSINRMVLGPKVFSDPASLQRLNEIVWPSIQRLAQDQVQEYRNQGKAVCVLDAAVLLEAGWDRFTHEVWTCIVPKKEAVQRIMTRDGLVEERAVERIESQMSNEERVARSNVVLCTIWEPEITQKQVEKAWNNLTSRLRDRPTAQQPKL